MNTSYFQDYRERHRKLLSMKEKNRYAMWKNTVVLLMGGRCAMCGFEDVRALQVDHINGGGSKEHAKFSKSNKVVYLKQIIRSIEAKENKYQLLCANCNWIKRKINKEFEYKY